MAIFQDVDKCMRCNGCVIACKRTWQMKAETIGVHKVSYDQRLAIKSQKRVDMGPFVRFSCWHCEYPPCASNCPFKAIVKKANGAVEVDMTKCNPLSSQCTRQCVRDCQRGGYPKVGVGSDKFGTPKAYKCTLCFGRAGAGGDLPTRKTAAELAAIADVDLRAEVSHEPSCVFTCPAKAMMWDSRANIATYIKANGYTSFAGDGSVYWASKKSLLASPKADPLVEDHISPMVANLLSGPFAKVALVPTLLLGGLLAFSARRANNEIPAMTGEEV